MIQATEYWNKVSKYEGFPFGIKPLPEYEIKSQWKIDCSFEELKKRVKNHPRMTIEDNKIIEDKGEYYGIHSYIVYHQAGSEVSSPSGP